MRFRAAYRDYRPRPILSLVMKTPAKTNKPAARDPIRTREALLSAAFAEIHRSGFRGADVNSILRAAGVTKGALYHHFENKDALGYAIVDEVVADIMRQKWQVPLRDAENPINALVGIVKGTPLGKHDIELGCPLNNIAQEMSPLDEGFRRRTAKLFREWQSAIAKALREGKERGVVDKRVDPDESSMFLVAAYEGYISLAKNSQDVAGLKAGLGAMVGYLNTLRVRPVGRLQARGTAAR
jgi:TetR/AcrR family transcriptional regulator, transcriptional repressor for nem operon